MIPLFDPDEFAAPQPEWIAPVVPPDVDPDFTPVDVPISCYWIPFVAGACKALLQQSTWKTSSASELQTILGRVECLLAIFATAIDSSACNDLLPAIACTWDFTVTDGSWHVQRTATWLPLFGWQSVPTVARGTTFLNGLWIYQTFTAIYVTRIEVDILVVCGNTDFAAGTNNNLELSHSGTPSADFNELVNPCNPTMERTIVLEQPATLTDRIDVFWYANYGSSQTPGAGVSIKEVRVFGRGNTNPCAS